MSISDWSSDVCSSDLLERVAKVDGATANFLVATALLLIIPSFVFFGWLSDKVGRKPIMMTACVIAVFVYFPAYKALVAAANPAMAAAVERAPVRSEEHTSELQSLMRISYAVFCLKKKK